jgi:hypothetical protein
MSIVLLGSTSGSCTLQEQAVAGTSVLTLPVGSGTVVANNVNSAIVSGTEVASTSGTSIDFTDIPSWAKRITVMFNNVSTSGTSFKQIQLIYGGGTVVTSGYRTSSARASSSGTIENETTTGFGFNANNAADDMYGSFTLTNVSGNTWVGFGGFTYEIGCLFAAGGITLSGVLTGVRVTTVNGTDTFDAGTINILYE